MSHRDWLCLSLTEGIGPTLAGRIVEATGSAAAACEAIGSLGEWSAPLVRVYYLTGAVLVVGYLALGELYLLAGRKIARFAPGVAMLVTAFAAALVFNAPVDESKLAHDGWEALETSTAIR